MFARSDNGFAHDVGQIGADHEIHWQTGTKQSGAGQETAPDAEKASQDADHKTDRDQVNRAQMDAGDGEGHDWFPRGWIQESNSRVKTSSRKPWPMIKASDTAA